MATHGNKVNAIRDYYIVKANDLIREGRYNLTTQQQKIILYAISKIKKHDDPRQLYEIQIDELCAACDLDIDAGGTYYHRIKNDLLKLTTRLWVQFPDQSEGTISWLSDAYIIPLSGTVQIRWHDKLWPYLFGLQERYTQYHLSEVLVFKNKYAIRLFEILRSYCTQEELDAGINREITISLEQLREQLCISAYQQWKEFHRNVLQKAVTEINQYAEQMQVSYQTKRTGRSITSVVFTVESPNVTDRIVRYKNGQRRLTQPRKEG